MDKVSDNTNHIMTVTKFTVVSQTKEEVTRELCIAENREPATGSGISSSFCCQTSLIFIIYLACRDSMSHQAIGIDFRVSQFQKYGSD